MKLVQIKSLEEMIDIMSECNRHNVVSIRDSQGADSVISKGMFNVFGRNAKSVYAVTFDDTTFTCPGTVPPTVELIRGILDWSMDKDDLIVHCTAGVSRSAAVAFLIECVRRDPMEAVDILNPAVHEPNELVVRIGARLISERVMDAYKIFLERQREHLLGYRKS